MPVDPVGVVVDEAPDEGWSDEQVRTVYEIQGTLRATARVLRISYECVRQVLQRQGVDTSNPDARGTPPTVGVPPLTCARCGVVRNVAYSPSSQARSKHPCCRPCANVVSGETRQRVSDAALVAACRELPSVAAVAAHLGVTQMAVRSRLGKLYFRELRAGEEEDDGENG